MKKIVFTYGLKNLNLKNHFNYKLKNNRYLLELLCNIFINIDKAMRYIFSNLSI